MRLSAENLGIRRGGRFALRGVDAVIEPGARVLVRGPAGSGKTTLLKALAGLLFADEGELFWDGAAVRRLGAHARRTQQAQLGMVFQSDALFDSATVLDNVTLPLVKRGVPPTDAAMRARAALDDVGLGGAAAQRPEVLSGGMRKRVGIARAIVAEPAVLIADDPFAGLDPHTALEVGKVLSRAAQGRTLIVAGPEALPWISLPQVVQLPEVEFAPEEVTAP